MHPSSVLVLCCLLLLPARAAAQNEMAASADTTEAGGIDIGFRFIPDPLWSESAGFGAGVEVAVKGLLGPATAVELRAEPAQHRGTYGAALQLGDPFDSPLSLRLSGRYGTEGRGWFYGVGPGTSKDNRIALEKRAVQARLAGTIRLAGPSWHLLPEVRYLRHHHVRFRNWEEDAFSRLDPQSASQLLFIHGFSTYPVVEADDVQSGLALRLGLSYDGRDARDIPTKGPLIQAFVEGFRDTGGLGIRYVTYDAHLYYFIPVAGERQVLGLRAIAALTRHTGETPVPYYLLPSSRQHRLPGYAGNRLFGRDLLLVGAEYRYVLFELPTWLGVELLMTATVANAYDDLFEQFAPAVSFSQDIEAEDGRFPLRPSLGLGGRIIDRMFDDVKIGGMIGLSPEGFRLLSFSFVYDPRDAF